MRTVVEDAEISIQAYVDLANAIAKAEEKYGEGSMAGAEDFKAVIEKAKEINNNLDATLNEIANAIISGYGTFHPMKWNIYNPINDKQNEIKTNVA